MIHSVFDFETSQTIQRPRFAFMTYDEFQHLARIFVLGGIDAAELSAFEEGRKEFGARAEGYIAECRRLESAFALSLPPQHPHPDARERLLSIIGAGRQPAPPRGKDRPLHAASEGEL